MRGKGYKELRREIDASTTTTSRLDPRELASIAADASTEGREKEAIKILAEIPPITLGRATYRVAYASKTGYELLGARGGTSSLVQNQKNPDLWAHVTMSGYRGKSVWYKRLPDGTFVPL